MLVRDYTPADRAACLAVFATNTQHFFLPEEAAEFAAFLNQLPGPYLVVIEDERVVGCGGFRVAGDTAVLTWGMVRRERHRERIGWRLLVARLARIVATPGVVRVRNDTSQHSRGFFERAGFVVTRVQPDGYGPGLDRHRMELVLDDVRRQSLLGPDAGPGVATPVHAR
jgi:hypothetical protein